MTMAQCRSSRSVLAPSKRARPLALAARTMAASAMASVVQESVVLSAAMVLDWAPSSSSSSSELKEWVSVHLLADGVSVQGLEDRALVQE